MIINDISILGSSGFIGQNLLSSLERATSISLRNPAWRDKVALTDVIINLVGKAHDHKGTAEEKDYYFANMELAQEVFRVFVDSSASLLIHVSSIAAVEEFESTTPLTEVCTCNPLSCYGQSKHAAEKWLLSQKMPAGKKLIIIRPPMVHGPGDKGNLRLLYNLISKGVPYPLSSFNNKRSFISIGNFCFFVKQIIEKQDHLSSGIYHVADDEPISTKEIIEIIKKDTNMNAINIALPKTVIRLLAKIGDFLPIPLNTKRLKKLTSDLIVSNKKIKEALNLDRLPLSGKEGLERTLKSFKKLN